MIANNEVVNSVGNCITISGNTFEPETLDQRIERIVNRLLNERIAILTAETAQFSDSLGMKLIEPIRLEQEAEFRFTHVTHLPL